ncbi:hypothetical protein BDZ91DRAFT_721427 [Kalaharituber pfeilii]|nr:hypothetical protein BDZ91DRAFT_721427 [Kalaharituber pfeilii]
MALPETTEDLKAHLRALRENPSSTVLRVRLVETFTAQLTDVENLAPALVPDIVPLVASVLQVVQQDPTCLTILLQRLLQHVPFSNILSLAEPRTFLALLQSPAPSIQYLGLFLLEKASQSSGDVAIVATWNDVCMELVKTVLCAADTGVHNEAQKVLLALLRVDLPENFLEAGGDSTSTSSGSGLFWRRIFSDRDIYELILRVCSWNESNESFSVKTRAQSRLLGLIPRLAELDWSMITATTFPDLVGRFSISSTSVSNLLDFAILGMVKSQNDVMMEMLHIDFFSSLLASTAPSDKALAYLSQPKIAKHQQCIGFFLHPHIFTKDDMDISLLQSRAAKYCSTYSELFPEHLIDASAASILLPNGIASRLPTFSWAKLADLILTHIAQAMDHVRKPEILYNPPATSLHLLTSLPTSVLLSPPSFAVESQLLSAPLHQRWVSSGSIITLIPLSPPSSEYISTLAVILSSSRSLYSIFTTFVHNQEYRITTPIAAASDLTAAPSSTICAAFWGKILGVARAPALAGACLASISLIHSVASAKSWDGLVEVMKQIDLMEFILRPPERHTARRVADPESTEFRIATLKYEVVQVLAKGVRECGGDSQGVFRAPETAVGTSEKVELAKRWGKVIMQRARMGLWESEMQPVIGTMEL